MDERGVLGFIKCASLFIVEIEGKKYSCGVQLPDSTIGDGPKELPEGEPFEGVPWGKLFEGLMIEVDDYEDDEEEKRCKPNWR